MANGVTAPGECPISGTHAEEEGLVEDGVQGVPHDLRLVLLLPLGEDGQLHVGVARAVPVHGRQPRGPDDGHRELKISSSSSGCDSLNFRSPGRSRHSSRGIETTAP